MEWTCVVCKTDNTTVGCCERCFNPKNHRLNEEITATGWPCFRCSRINSKVNFYCKDCLTPRYYVERSNSNESCILDKERRLILIGKTGSGKSATGNCILNKDVFESSVSNSSITQKCQRGTTYFFGNIVQVVDTPGLFDTGMDNDQVTTEILKCIGISAPGPHAFLMIIAIRRFTEEEMQTVELLRHVFGDQMENYIILIFTRKDELDYGKKTIESLLETAPPFLRKLVKDCGDRYIAWNNYGSDEEKKAQVKKLFDIVEEMLIRNDGKFFQSEVFEKTEEIVKQREQEIKEEFEEKNQEKLKMYRRQLSDNYHEQINVYLQREQTLQVQIQNLQVQQEDVAKNIQRDLNQLCDDIEEFSSTSEDVDFHKSQILEQLKERIDEARSSLEDVQRQQVLLYQMHEKDCTEKEQEWDFISKGLDARDEVRQEIESGKPGILIRFWDRLRNCGKTITDGFISIFKHIKKKLPSKKVANE